jgi:hypothetical protein
MRAGKIIKFSGRHICRKETTSSQLDFFVKKMPKFFYKNELFFATFLASCAF